MSFICEKKNVSIKRERLIEALKKEKIQLQERLNAISIGPHAQRELKVRTDTKMHFIIIFHEITLLTVKSFYGNKLFKRLNVKYVIY